MDMCEAIAIFNLLFVGASSGYITSICHNLAYAGLFPMNLMLKPKWPYLTLYLDIVVQGPFVVGIGVDIIILRIRGRVLGLNLQIRA